MREEKKLFQRKKIYANFFLCNFFKELQIFSYAIYFKERILSFVGNALIIYGDKCFF